MTEFALRRLSYGNFNLICNKLLGKNGFYFIMCLEETLDLFICNKYAAGLLN